MSASSGAFGQGWFQTGTLCRLATPDLEWRAANMHVWARVCIVCTCVYTCVHVCICICHTGVCVQVVPVVCVLFACVCCVVVFLGMCAYVHVYIRGVYCVQAHTYVHMCTCAHMHACVPSGEERKDTGHTLVTVASPACGLLSIPAPSWLGSRMEGTQAQEGSWLRCLASCCDSRNGMDVMGGSLAR